jgi:signal peptidase I
MKILREIGITILIAIAIFVLLRFTIQGYRVQYSCMLPNIEDGEWIMVNKANYFFSEPKRGEVIIFEHEGSRFPYIKRIIGLPDETIKVKDGKVYIGNGTNSIPLEEEYIMEPPRYTMSPETIPEGEYFVLGDNRNNSNDSHNGWTVPRDNIIGKAWFVYWPPSKWGVVKHYGYPELTRAGKQEAVICSLVGGMT